MKVVVSADGGAAPLADAATTAPHAAGVP